MVFKDVVCLTFSIETKLAISHICGSKLHDLNFVYSSDFSVKKIALHLTA